MSLAKRIRLYGAILGVLVVVFVLGSIFSPGRARTPAKLFPGLEAAAVTEIELSGAGQITLRLESGEWELIEDSMRYPARADRVESLVAEASAGEVVRKVTSREDLWGEFGLDDSGIELILRAGAVGTAGRTSSLVWGAESAEQGLGYFRRPSGPDVYASSADLGFYLRQPATYWSYLRVLPENVAPGDIVSVRSTIDLSAGTGDSLSHSFSARLATPDSTEGQTRTWVSDSDGAELDPVGMERLLRDISTIVGSDFARTIVGETTEAGEIEIDLSDGRTFAIEISASNGGYVCTATGPDLPGDRYGGLAYQLTLPTIRRLFPEPDSLVAP